MVHLYFMHWHLEGGREGGREGGSVFVRTIFVGAFTSPGAEEMC